MRDPKDHLGPTRRQALMSCLFGAGAIGLRALATGLPPALLLHPERALAEDLPGACADARKAQYLIFNTLSSGDPFNANVPGSYDHPAIVHPADPAMARTAVVLRGRSYQGAKPWSELAAWVRDRAAFIHHATLTNSHANQPKVMRLMDAVKRQEMLLSLLAKSLAPCLGTVQREPMTIGASGPTEALSFEGRSLPILRPTALKSMLLSPAGPLFDLQKRRDADLDRLSAVFKKSGTPAQRAFLDDMARSQGELRKIVEDVGNGLSAVTRDDVDGQIQATLALLQMNVAPVISIRIPFGGDNHADADFERETAQTVAGAASINKLMLALETAGLRDRVTFAAMNVFGRTLTNRHRAEDRRLAGRDHYASHHCTLLIGPAVKGGVYGGVGERMANADVSAMPINSQSGAADLKGDIAFDDTLAATGKTIGAALGVPAAVLDDQITRGKPIRAALA